MSSSLSGLIPQLQPFAQALIRYAGASGMAPRVTSTRRSSSEQLRLYRNFLSGHSQYPVAPPGTSAHEFGFAFDMLTNYAEYLPRLGQVWESWGGVWGGRFKDPIHFEFPGFKSRPFTPESPFWSAAYQGINWASIISTPLFVEKNDPSVQARQRSLAAEIESWLGL